MPESDNNRFAKEARRRRILSWFGTAGLVSVAGCFSASEDDDDPTDTSSATDTVEGTGTPSSEEGTIIPDDTSQERSELPMMDQTYRLPHYDENPRDTTLFTEEWWNTPSIDYLLRVQGGWKPMFADEHVPMLFEDVAVSADEVTITIHEDAEWSDGTPVVAEDIFRYFRTFDTLWQPIQPGDRNIDEIRDPMSAVAPPEGGFWLDDALIADGKEATFLSGPGYFTEKWTEESVAEAFWGLPVVPPHDPDIYVEINDRLEEYHREYDEPRQTDEHEEWRDFVFDDDWDIGLDHLTEGPFKIDEVTDDRYILERHDGYPHADVINFQEIETVYAENAEAHRTALVSDHLDWTDNVEMPDHAISSLPEYIEEFQHPQFSGNALAVHGQHEQLGKPRVRQALMHIIDREQITTLMEDMMVAGEPIDIPGAQSGNDEIVSQDFLDQLHDYPADEDRAAELLRSAGFSNEGGEWYTPDGDVWEFAIHTAGDEIPEFELIIEDQLTRFGLNAEVMTLEDAVYEDRYDNANYDVISWTWSGERENLFNDFFWAIHSGIYRQQRGFWTHEEAQEIADQRDSLFYLEEEAQEEGTYADIQGVVGGNLVDYTISAPPIGEFDSEPTEEYSVADHAIRFQYGYTFDDVDYTFEDAVRETMWVYNWWLPEMPINTEFDHAFHNTRDWVIPEDSAASLWQSSYQFIPMGLISADPDGRGEPVE